MKNETVTLKRESRILLLLFPRKNCRREKKEGQLEIFTNHPQKDEVDVQANNKSVMLFFFFIIL